MTFDGHDRDEIQSRLSHVTYLQDNSIVVEGLRIHGSPWTVERPWSPASAFMSPAGTLTAKHWHLISDDTDVLVTHSPPKDILDNRGTCGCGELREEIFNRIRLCKVSIMYLKNKFTVLIFKGNASYNQPGVWSFVRPSVCNASGLHKNGAR